VVVTKTEQREGRRQTKSQKSGKGKGSPDGEGITKGGKGTKSPKSGKGKGCNDVDDPVDEIPIDSESPSVSLNPSSAPSNVPSVSVNPSLAPSTSSAPSNVPSLSVNPSVAVSMIECALQLYL